MCRSCHGDCWLLVANQRNALDKDLLPKCGQVQSTRLPGAEWSRGGGAEGRWSAVVCRGGAVRARQMRSDFANNVPEGASTSRRPRSQRGTRLCGKAQATCRSSLLVLMLPSRVPKSATSSCLVHESGQKSIPTRYLTHRPLYTI